MANGKWQMGNGKAPLTLPLSPKGRGIQENPLTLTLSPMGRGK